MDVQKGSFVKIAVNHEVIQLLGEDGSCVQTQGEDASRDFDTCMFEEMRNLMMKEVLFRSDYIYQYEKQISRPKFSKFSKF